VTSNHSGFEADWYGSSYESARQTIRLPQRSNELGLEFRRYYNSQSSHPGLLGANWRMGYETVLYDFGGQIQIVQADGQRLMFQRGLGARAALCSTPRASDGQIRIEEPKDGRGQRTYHWRWPDGRSLMFSGGAGGGYPLQAITASSGQRLTLAYSPGGELIPVRDPQGRKVRPSSPVAERSRSTTSPRPWWLSIGRERQQATLRTSGRTTAPSPP
jgi:hypothetical protein